MTITSYAQNFEDVILWRALKNVDRGFYIDIGAQDPVVDSVSLAFYEKGWRGVHVEPTAAYAEKLRQSRPDETVIQAAIGTSAESIAFWEFPESGLSTGDADIAMMHEHDNRNGIRVEVPCMRLSTLLSDYRNRHIHWLKIDVEGMELAVIQSWLPASARPWIVVVESMKPLSRELTFADWEPLLVKLGYEFVYFDGVNRFYVSVEHPELKKYFGPGPNCFDEFSLSEHAQAVTVWKRACADLHHELAERDKKIAGVTATAKSLEVDLATRTEALAAVYASTSWRLTAPLRGASGAVRRFARGGAWPTLGPGSRPRRLARRGAVAVARFFLVRPRLMQPARGLLRRFPAIHERLRIMRLRLMRSPSDSDLSLHARSVYAELVAAIAVHKGRR